MIHVESTAREWCNNHINEVITKVSFAKILETAVKTAIKAEILRNGFKACGLCPFNPDNIDYSKCLGKQKDKTLQSLNNNQIIKPVRMKMVMQATRRSGIVIHAV